MSTNDNDKVKDKKKNNDDKTKKGKAFVDTSNSKVVKGSEIKESEKNKAVVESNSNVDILEEFKEIAKESKSVDELIEKLKKMNNVTQIAADEFYTKYGDDGKLSIHEAAEKLFNEVNISTNEEQSSEEDIEIETDNDEKESSNSPETTSITNEENEISTDDDEFEEEDTVNEEDTEIETELKVGDDAFITDDNGEEYWIKITKIENDIVFGTAGTDEVIEYPIDSIKHFSESKLGGETNENKLNESKFTKGFVKGDTIIDDHNNRYIVVKNGDKEFTVGDNGERRERIIQDGNLKHGNATKGDLSLDDIKENKTTSMDKYNEVHRLLHLMDIKEGLNNLLKNFELTDIDKIKETIIEELTEEELNIVLEDVYKELEIEVKNELKEDDYIKESLRNDLGKKLI